MSDIKIQRGVVDFGASADSATATISAVGSLGKAFARITGVQHNSGGLAAGDSTGGAKNNDDMGMTCLLTATDTVTFTRLAAGQNSDYRVYFEVWEYVGSAGGANEFLVRYHNNVSMASGTGQVDQDVSDIATLGDCVPFVCGITNENISANWHAALVTLTMVSGTPNKVRLDRNNTSNANVVSVAVVEFTGSAWTVQQNVSHAVSAATTQTETITDVTDWATAFIVGSFRADAANDDDIGNNFWRGATTTAIKFRSLSGGGDFVVHVVKHADLDVEHLDSIDGGGTDHPAGSASPQTVNTTVTTLSDTAAAALIGSTQSAQTANRGPRPNWQYRLTSTSNAEWWVARHDDADEWALQVLDFSGVASSSGSVGSTAGVATVSGVGRSTAASAGLITAAATADGIGRSTASSFGSSAGAATAAASGRTTAAAIGASANGATALAAGAAIHSSAGGAACMGSVAGVGASIAAAAGASAGAAAVNGFAPSAGGYGTAQGASSALAVGVAISSAQGQAMGAAVVSAAGTALWSAIGSAFAGSTATAHSPGEIQTGRLIMAQARQLLLLSETRDLVIATNVRDLRMVG
jgi:hypothetical protein